VLDISPDGVPIAAIATCYNGPVAAAEKVLRPLREFGRPVVDMIAPMPYVRLQQMLDPRYPSRRRSYWKSGFLRALEDDAIDTMIEHFRRRPSPLDHMLIEHLGGAVRRVDRDATAFDHRESDYNFTALAMWTDPAGDEANVAWARDAWKAMQSCSDGVYVNYLSEEGEERVRAAYGPQKYERLVALKRKYDPMNLFRMNQNVVPGPV